MSVYVSARSLVFGTLVLLAGFTGVQLSEIMHVPGVQQHSTLADDPLFGDGCRYVAVDTPTPAQPHATLCRPFFG